MKYEWDGQEFDTQREVERAISVRLAELWCDGDTQVLHGETDHTISILVEIHPLQ